MGSQEEEVGEEQAGKRVCLDCGEEEDLIRQYQEAALLPPPLTRAGIPSGVQAGRQLSVGTLFSPEDRGVAMEVVRDHRGQREGLVACIGWCESPGVGSCIVCR